MNAALILICATAFPAEIRHPTPLAHALRDGSISVKAASHSGHSIARLKIRNERQEPLLVDVCGSYLEPDDESYQRLGLGLVRAGDGDTTVALKPRRWVRLKVLSVCMDSSKSSPWRGRKYTLSPELAPLEILSALEEWRNNPHTPQGEIQSAVWRRRTVRPIAAPPVNPIPVNWKKLVPYDDRLFILKDDGGLFFGGSLKELTRVPGAVFDVWAGDSVYAVREEVTRGPTGVPQTVVSRFDLETRGWANLSIRGVKGQLKWVSENEDEALVLNPRGELLHVTEGEAFVVVKGARLLEVLSKDRIYWVPRKAPRTLQAASLKKRRHYEVYRHHHAYLGMTRVRDSLYFLDSRGTLAYFGRKGPRRLRGHVSFIQPAGDQLLVGTSEEGNPLQPAPGQLHFYRRDRSVRSFHYPGGNDLRYFFDPKAKRLFCIDQSRALNSLGQSWNRVR